MKENKIQSDCFQWFWNNYVIKDNNYFMFSVPNELAGNNKIATMQAKAMGLVAGVSDTIIIIKDKVIFCEFKDSVGKQSEKQKYFEKRVTNLKYEYWLIRDFETFKQKINNLCLNKNLT